MNDYFKYRYSDNIEFNVNYATHLSIIGNSNSFFLNTLLNTDEKCNIFIGDKELTKDNMLFIRKRIGFVLYKHLDIFVGETVEDEIAFGLESLAYKKKDIKYVVDVLSKRFKIDHLLNRDPNSLGNSDKVKMKILSALVIKPNILVLDNVLSFLDFEDKKIIVDVLDEFKKNQGIIFNVTNNIEESLLSDRIIILQDKKLICDGNKKSVLNEEKLLKRLGIGLPFIVELNKYFMDYGIVNKYYFDNSKLVNALWK